MELNNCDFSGWATRVDVKCSDGRVIKHGAFADDDHKYVPLVWNHQHNDVTNVLGRALLEHRDEGVYAYCSFNDSDYAQTAKLAVEHGDVTSLSIFANHLVQEGYNVTHGIIREVSLVLAGANPYATIMEINHSDEDNSSAVIYSAPNDPLVLAHEDSENNELDASENKPEENVVAQSDLSVKAVMDNMSDTKKAVMCYLMQSALNDKNIDLDKNEVQAVVDSFTDDEKTVMHAMVGQVVTSKEPDDNKETTNNNEEDSEMKHNLFDGSTMNGDDTTNTPAISQSDLQAIMADAPQHGSLKRSAKAHGITNIPYTMGGTLAHGVNNLDYLFPDDRNITNAPIMISRNMGWVRDVMGSVHHTPFSRVKSLFADITAEEARAKGYIKGKYKEEEFFTLLKRVTGPTTVYKKQKLDRDDLVDLANFNIVPWIKTEMRQMLDEELARAYLIGDGRASYDSAKINELCIRPIWKDEDLFTIKATFKPSKEDADTRAKEFIRMAIKSRKNYKGSGSPVLFTTEDMLTDCLLLTDANGRDLYDTEDKLAKKLRVSKIITVPVMEGQTRAGRNEVEGESGKTYELLGIIVNLNDYNVGADKGGAVNMFDDFDIDYNAEKYLIETRCSAALTVPYSAIALEAEKSA